LISSGCSAKILAVHNLEFRETPLFSSGVDIEPSMTMILFSLMMFSIEFFIIKHLLFLRLFHKILFLDIELPGDNGVYAGKYIRETLHNDRMNIVFISHKTSYAMELFQIHPYDFLIKPIDDNVLYDTMTKILQLEDVQKKEFRYTYNKTGYSIPYGEIMLFSSRNKTITICKTDGESVSYYGKLSDIVSNLPFQFVCISKSYIVNIKCIKSWKSDAVLLKNGMEISIAQSKRASFKQAIFNYGRSKDVI